MTTPRPWALVTGASSGIGADLAAGLARRGYGLLLTGRDAARLEAVAAPLRSTTDVEVLSLDLTDADAAERLQAWTAGRRVEVLVNNAGFGGSDPVAQASPAELRAMVRLNVEALTLITQAFVPGLIAQGRGRILNVGSTASFSPIPGMAVYAATKAYVLSFSEALAEELRGTGVTVTTLCPGPTATRFAERAALGASAVFRRAMPSDQVAAQALDALDRGRRVRVTGLGNQLLALSTRFAPRSLAASLAGRIMSREKA